MIFSTLTLTALPVASLLSLNATILKATTQISLSWASNTLLS